MDQHTEKILEEREKRGLAEIGDLQQLCRAYFFSEMTVYIFVNSYQRESFLFESFSRLFRFGEREVKLGKREYLICLAHLLGKGL